ncbi:MAG TPA: hypothetical protein V6D27_01095 [Vampirovibrionales bacterium]
MATLTTLLANGIAHQKLDRAIEIMTAPNSAFPRRLSWDDQQKAWALTQVFIVGSSSEKDLTEPEISAKTNFVIERMKKDNPSANIDATALINRLVDHYIYEGQRDS